jgi:hypothetical protein
MTRRATYQAHGHLVERTGVLDDGVADDLWELPTQLVGNEFIWELRVDTQGLVRA